MLSPADVLKPHPTFEGGAPDGSFANKKGRHTIGHVDDFRALQQQILEGKVLVHKMETVLQATLGTALLEFGSAKVRTARLNRGLADTKAPSLCPHPCPSIPMWVCRPRTTAAWTPFCLTPRPWVRSWTRPPPSSRCSGGPRSPAASSPLSTSRRSELCQRTDCMALLCVGC